MTENEAIKEIETSLELAEMCKPNREREKKIKAYKMAIQALGKVQQFEAIGTIEEFKALKEKSVAKKPRWHGHYFCPNCNSIVYVNGGKDIYCPKCGQKLDWSE